MITSKKKKKLLLLSLLFFCIVVDKYVNVIWFELIYFYQKETKRNEDLNVSIFCTF